MIYGKLFLPKKKQIKRNNCILKYGTVIEPYY